MAPPAQSFLPDFKVARKQLKAGNEKPVKMFVDRVLALIAPNGKRADWLAGLSTQRQNMIKRLRLDMDGFLVMMEEGVGFTDPEQQNSYLAFIMEPWARPLRTLEIASAVADAGNEIPHDPFTVIPIPGVTRVEVDGALAALDEAAFIVEPQFPRLLYGRVYLTRHLAKGTAAWYDYASDSLALNVKAKKRFSDVFSLCHELGHRHHHKFCSAKSRMKYKELSKRKRDPLHVTPYGATSAKENYADGFAHFVLGMDMPDALADILDTEMNSKRGRVL